MRIKQGIIINMEINKLLENKIQAAYGSLTGRLLSGFSVCRKMTFRANTLKSTEEIVAEELRRAEIPFEIVNGAFVTDVTNDGRVRALEIYTRGGLYVQSLSSMLPPLALAPVPGENILDMCAAPGGKTSQISAMTGGGAYITACEKNAVRAEKLRHNLALLGVKRTTVLVTDAGRLDPVMKFDRILLDAPCTGSGTITPRAPGCFSAKLLAACVKAQKTLITRAAMLLKKGGVLVYSTCSLLPEENEDVVSYALKSGLDIEPVGIVPERAELLPVRTEGALLVAPDEYYEGFFVAKLIKR